MNTNLQNKSKEESDSLDFQESNKVFNKNNANTLSALISKGEISRENLNSIEKRDLDCQVKKSKDTTPHLKVSVDFAAEQWLQIVLIHLNSQNKKLSGVLEPIGGCLLGSTSGI